MLTSNLFLFICVLFPFICCMNVGIFLSCMNVGFSPSFHLCSILLSFYVSCMSVAIFPSCTVCWYFPVIYWVLAFSLHFLYVWYFTFICSTSVGISPSFTISYMSVGTFSSFAVLRLLISLHFLYHLPVLVIQFLFLYQYW